MKYRLGDICTIKSGGTPSRSNIQYYSSSYMPWAKVGDLDQGSLLTKTEEYISKEGLESIGNRVFEEGTVLLAMYGSVGKTAIAGVQLSSNQAVLGINSNNKHVLDNWYLKYWFDYHKALLLFKSKGGTLKNLSATYIKNLIVDLPDIQEQRRIVTRLERILEFKQKREQTFTLIDNLVNGLFVKTFGDPIINENNWVKGHLQDFGDWSSGGTPPRKETKYFVGGTIPWFTSGELNSFFVSESNEKITEEAIQSTNAKVVPKGSLMIGMYDTAALKTSIASIDCSCNQAIAFCKLNDDLDPLFTLIAIQIGKNYYLNKRKGARQKNLNISFIRSIELILPPIDLQKKFSNTIEIIINQSGLYQRSKELLQEIYEVILFKTFNHDPQNKIDEVSELINDEIRLELFLNTINASDYDSEEEYDSDIKKLHQILHRTTQQNKNNPNYLKGIIQRIEGDAIILETNKEYKYRLSDEATANKNQ